MKKKDYIKFNGYEIIKIGAEKILIDDNFREKSDNEIEHFYNILPLKDNFSEIETSPSDWKSGITLWKKV